MWIRGGPDSKHCVLFLAKTFCVKIEEEELLRAELRKIEARKKEREKKTADLQKLIAQADSSAAEVSDLCFRSLCPLFLLTVSGLGSSRIRSLKARGIRIQNRCYESGSALSFLWVWYTDKSH
jgi:hypothetical protein